MSPSLLMSREPKPTGTTTTQMMKMMSKSDGRGSLAHPITPKARTRRRYSGYSGKAAARTPSS